MNRPDFSPAMLRTFLRLRADLAVINDAEAAEDSRVRRRVVQRFRTDLRKRAGVSAKDLRKAWDGAETLPPEPRRKIWAAMDLDPADAGYRLTENGGQERA